MKTYIKTCLFCFLFLASCNLYAASISIGTLSKSPLTVVVNNCSIETYNVFGTNYIAVSKLRSAGFQIQYTKAHEPLYIQTPLPLPTIEDLTKPEYDGKEFTTYAGEVYIGNFKTQAISCEGNVLIPVAALTTIFDASLLDNFYTLTPKKGAPILATQTSVKNYSDFVVEVSLEDLYWDDQLIQKTLYFTLQPGQVLERQASSDKQYLTTIVSSAVYDGFCYKNTTLCGQNNDQLLRCMDFARSLPEDIGDKATLSMLYDATKKVNAANLTSKTPYLVWTNLDQQRTYIFTSVDNKWQLYKNFICSSGKPSTPTPTGTYKLTKKVPSFGQDHGYCCKNAFGFIGTTYLFHSILFDKTGTYLLEGRGVLGKKASDGCIRLSPENSAWFYNNMVSGTTVWIS